ncbi:patatin-like phospholipase family protein [Sphingomonas jaspsi]|uniref:patatin-like phospholipase family protein n=1 Tax=Sphingomonas jaspsi TaxID=392409 RepID=UPI0004B0932B|nr:patatin-like phospholipase family protein [Sphingomonas jaspsi]
MASAAREAHRRKVGLALSGGGFRAVLFHVGALWRLAELGILAQLDRVSSVSGGSIAAGRLASCWAQWAADPTVERYRALIADPLDHFCTQHVDAVAISRGALSPFRTAADVLEEIYAHDLFDTTLDRLPDHPAFIFCATNMQTGRLFRFSKKRLADYRLGEIRSPALPLARAVAASSAFPPMLSPVILKDLGDFQPWDGADLNGDPHYTRKIVLADGGVYDNLGLEQVWGRTDFCLVSDAGAPFAVGPNPGNDWVRQPMRALDIATDQSRGLRKRWLIDMANAGRFKGAYWGIDTDIADYQLSDTMPADPNVVDPLARIRTRLDPFGDADRGRLTNWGYALADAAIRKYAPGLIAHTAPPAWPRPAYRLFHAANGATP